MAALFEPFGNCAELLNPAVVKPLLSNGFEFALKYAEGLQEVGFKEKVNFSFVHGYSLFCIRCANCMVIPIVINLLVAVCIVI